jgi:hypothetical protein
MLKVAKKRVQSQYPQTQQIGGAADEAVLNKNN